MSSATNQRSDWPSANPKHPTFIATTVKRRRSSNSPVVATTAPTLLDPWPWHYCVNHGLSVRLGDPPQLPGEASRQPRRLGRAPELPGPAHWPRPEWAVLAIRPSDGPLHGSRGRAEVFPGHVHGAAAERALPGPNIRSRA